MGIKRVIYMNFVLLLTVALLLITVTMMWFGMNKTASNKGILLQSQDVPRLGYELYIFDDETLQWVQYDSLELPEHMVSNQSVQCKLVMTNSGDSECAISVDFAGIVNGVSEDNYHLSDVLEFVGVGPQGASFAPRDTFTNLCGNTNHFKALYSVTVASRSNVDILFNIVMRSDAGNEYAEKTITIGQIQITASTAVS